MPKSYKLEMVEMPSKKSHGLYDTVVREFLESGNPSARLSIPDRTPKTMQIGLSKAMQVSGTKNVGVSIRGGDVYLFLKG